MNTNQKEKEKLIYLKEKFSVQLISSKTDR